MKLLLSIYIFTSTLLFSGESFGIVAIFNNEAPYLKEWIEYHLEIGFSYFLLYDHNSSDNYKKVLDPYIKKGLVELKHVNGFEGRVRNIQPTIYSEATKKLKHKLDWVAIIDIDEFILPMRNRNIQDTISQHFKNASLIYVNWRNFGTSNQYLSSSDSILDKLISCSFSNHSRNAVGKSLVKLCDIDFNVKPTPHICFTKPNKLVFYGDGTRLYNNGKPFIHKKDLMPDGKHHDKYIRINHYFTKDKNFWKNIKLPRIKKRGEHNLQMYLQQEKDFSIARDRKILLFLKKFHNAFYKKCY